jgi:hypothetical protein
MQTNTTKKHTEVTMSKEKQTAVEWLVKELGIADDSLLFPKVEQAKEMEKQQIMKAFLVQSPIEDGIITAVKKSEQYYKETYEAKEM